MVGQNANGQNAKLFVCTLSVLFCCHFAFCPSQFLLVHIQVIVCCFQACCFAGTIECQDKHNTILKLEGLWEQFFLIRINGERLKGRGGGQGNPREVVMIKVN